MARRRKTSFAEDLMDLVAMLPWWGGVLLALLSHPLLHRLAVKPLMPSSGVLPTQAIWKGLATVGQYVLPLLCLAGAGMSAWRRSERTKLIVDVAQSQSTSARDGMSWREFEMLVGEGFRLQCYGGGRAPSGNSAVRNAELPHVREAHDEARGQTRWQRRTGLLGLHRLSILPRHAHNSMTALL